MKTLKYRITSCVAVLCCLMCFSCMDDEIVQNTTDQWCDGKTLILSLDPPAGTLKNPMTRSTQADTTLTDVSVLIYGTDGNLARVISPTGAVDALLDGNSYTVTVSDLIEQKGTVYAVANYGKIEETNSLFATESALKAATFGLEAGKLKPLMFAKGVAFDVTNASQNKPALSLTRIYSLVTVKVDMSGLTPGVTIVPQSVQLKHVPLKGWLDERTPREGINLPGSFILHKDEMLVDGERIEAPANDLNFLAKAHAEADALYLYENRQPDGTNVQGADGAGDQTKKTPQGFKPTDIASAIEFDYKCSYIELHANYLKGAGGVGSGTIRYRFFLGKDELNNFDVERNVHYQLTLSLKGNGGVDESSWRVETKLLGDIQVKDVYVGYRSGSKARMYVTGDGLGTEALTVSAAITAADAQDFKVLSSSLQKDEDGKSYLEIEIEGLKTNPHDYNSKVGTVEFTLTDDKGSTAKKTAKVYQVPRLVDPIAIYKRADNDKETEIIVREYNPDSNPGKYQPLVSKGPWSATIKYTHDNSAWFAIYLKDKATGKYQAAQIGETIEGEDEVRFFYKPKNANSGKTDRFGMILVKYHNEWCEHEIYLRQGYDHPVQMDEKDGGKAEWSAYNCLGWEKKEGGQGHITTSPTQTGWLFNGGVNVAMHPFKPGYREKTQELEYSDGTRGRLGQYNTITTAWETPNGSETVSSSSIGTQGPCPDGYVVPNAWQYRAMTEDTEITTGYVYDDDYTGTPHERGDGGVTYGWYWGSDGDAVVEDNNHSNPAKGTLFVRKADKCTNLFFGYGKGVLKDIRARDSKLVAEIGVGHRAIDGALTYSDHTIHGESNTNHKYGGFYWNATNFNRYVSSGTYHMGKVDFGYDVFSREPNLLDVPGQPASEGGGKAEGIGGDVNGSFVRCIRNNEKMITIEAAFAFEGYGSDTKYVSMTIKLAGQSKNETFFDSDLDSDGYLKSNTFKKVAVVNPEKVYFFIGGYWSGWISIDDLTNKKRKITFIREGGNYSCTITDIP